MKLRDSKVNKSSRDWSRRQESPGRFEESKATRTFRIFFSLEKIQLRRQKTCKVKKFSNVLLWMNFQLKYFNFLVFRLLINSWAKNVTHSSVVKKKEVRNRCVREWQMYFSISRHSAFCKALSRLWKRDGFQAKWSFSGEKPVSTQNPMHDHGASWSRFFILAFGWSVICKLILTHTEGQKAASTHED